MGIGAKAHGAARSKGADDPILTSKITVPTLPGWVVPRPRVEKLIAEGVQVRSPRSPVRCRAGRRGHRTVVRERLLTRCLAQPRPTTTVCLWSYVLSPCGEDVAAADHVGADTLCRRSAFLRLASVLAARDTPVTVVLDDLHLVNEPAILDGLAYILWNARR